MQAGEKLQLILNVESCNVDSWRISLNRKKSFTDFQIFTDFFAYRFSVCKCVSCLTLHIRASDCSEVCLRCVTWEWKAWLVHLLVTEIKFLINGGQKWPTHVKAVFERQGHPLETNESINLHRGIMVTNYMLITFVFISLIQEHKQLEMAGEDAQRLFSQTQ